MWRYLSTSLAIFAVVFALRGASLGEILAIVGLSLGCRAVADILERIDRWE